MLSEGKIKYDPRNLAALVDMKRPNRADELQPLLSAANWMRNAIPFYSELVAPLQSTLEEACNKLEKRTKRALALVYMTGLWGLDQYKAFYELKFVLANSTSISYPNNSHVICLFTDSSDDHLSAIMVQCPSDSMDEHVMERKYEPLGFLSRSFKGIAANWSVPEKEGFSIVDSMPQLAYCPT